MRSNSTHYVKSRFSPTRTPFIKIMHVTEIAYEMSRRDFSPYLASAFPCDIRTSANKTDASIYTRGLTLMVLRNGIPKEYCNGFREAKRIPDVVIF